MMGGGSISLEIDFNPESCSYENYCHLRMMVMLMGEYKLSCLGASCLINSLLVSSKHLP